MDKKCHGVISKGEKKTKRKRHKKRLRELFIGDLFRKKSYWVVKFNH